MIKSSCLLIVFLTFVNLLFAQNHVMNGGFESYDICPDGISSLERATHWTNPLLPSISSPDYINRCNSNDVGVPGNYFGYQQTHGGDAYAGIWTFLPDNNYREYVEGELFPLLAAGQCYHFEMYINEANHYGYATDDIAVSFLTSKLDSLPTNPLQLTATISNPEGAYPDTTNWMLVSGDFVATGGEQYFVIGNLKTTANTTYIYTGGNSAGGYIHIDDVSVTPCQPQPCATSSITNAAVCFSALPYTWNGNISHNEGTYYSTFTNAAGCDSSALLNLTVIPSPGSTSNVAICLNDFPYTWNGNSYTAAGTYSIILPASGGGCDSIATLSLSVLPFPFAYSYASVCTSELPFVWYGNNYYTGGAHQVFVPAGSGCDSLIKVFLTILPSPTSNTNISICSSSFPYLWNGNSYTTAGTYTVNFPLSGCDSVATLNLTALPAATSNTTINICTSQLPYIWNGNSYNATGLYTATLTGSNSCDSIATLNLTINPSVTSNNNFAICQSQLPFSWNGNNYNTAGTYTVTLTGSSGCDSIATLNLTVSQPTSGSSYITVCQSQLPYSWNGSSYNAAGVYQATLVNAAGCDSIVTLSLTISQLLSTTNMDICSSALPYTWNGNGYNIAGSYHAVLTGSNGCDSIATLNLSINPSPEVKIGNDTTLCMGKTLSLDVAVPGASYLWQDGSMNYFYNITANGTYWVKVSSNGCDNADTVLVDFKDCDCQPSIPNAFTPNGDGINDQWIITHQNCRYTIVISVFNRYGSLVFHSDNYQNDWKGTYRSGSCPDGTYYYVARLLYNNQREQIFKGNVTILR